MLAKYYVDILNKIDYIHNSDWLFATDGNNLGVINNKEVIYQYEDSDLKFEEIATNKMIEKQKNAIQNFCNISDIDLNENADIGYSPALEKNDGKTILCKVGGYLVPQNGLPICWAVCVATTYSYQTGKKITAKNVCDKINHAYTGEKKTSVVEKAFKKYDLQYHYSPYGLSIALIRRHLCNSKLLTVTLTNAFGRHTEVITGVKVKKNKAYLRIFDPNQNKGELLAEFKNYDTVFPGEMPYAWQGTFHCYD